MMRIIRYIALWLLLAIPVGIANQYLQFSFILPCIVVSAIAAVIDRWMAWLKEERDAP